jgi:hypothetical protein
MRWIGWTNLGLGMWLAAAGFALHHASGTGIVEDVVGGLLVALAALWATGAFHPALSAFASWTVAIGGFWIAIAPWVLGYEHPSVSVANDLAVGVIIFGLATFNVCVKDRRMHIARPAAFHH